MSLLKITTLTEQNTCNFCNNALAKYSCPKCNMLYCTLKCYQSKQHLSCSEQFYKDMVQEHLKSQSGGKEDSEHKMQAILKKFHEQNQLEDNDESNEELDSDDDENVEDLGDRLAGIDLDNSEQVWKHLTDEERKDFEAFLLSSDVAQFMPVWAPWWEYKSLEVLDTNALSKCKEQCPKIVEICKFNEISSKPPANCVENNMINVLAAYAFLQRYFNGEGSEFPLEFSMFLWNLSLNLNKNVNFDTARMAIESINLRCCSCAELGMTTDQDNTQHIKQDVNCLVAGPHSSERKFYLLSAFSDMKTTLKAAKVYLGKKDQSTGEFYAKFTAQQTKAMDSFTKNDIRAAIRKVEYYLSFVNDFRC